MWSLYQLQQHQWGNVLTCTFLAPGLHLLNQKLWGAARRSVFLADSGAGSVYNTALGDGSHVWTNVKLMTFSTDSVLHYTHPSPSPLCVLFTQ